MTIFPVAPGLQWRVSGVVRLPFANGEGRTGNATCTIPWLVRAFCKGDAELKLGSENLAAAHFPPQLQGAALARMGVTTFLGFPCNLGGSRLGDA